MTTPTTLRIEDLHLVDLASAPEEVKSRMRDLRNLPEIRDYMISAGKVSEEEHGRWLQSLGGNGRNRCFAVMAKGELAGQVNLTGIDRHNGYAEWGFFIAPAFRRRGVATAALTRLLDLAFDEFGLQKINAGVLDYNRASLAQHARFGFKEEGRRRRHKRHGDGWADLLLFGITAEEWRASRPEQ